MSRNKIVTALDVDHVTSVLQRRCADMGVTLTWTRNSNMALAGYGAHGNKTVILPAIHAPITQAAIDKLYGFVIHEAGHHTRPDCFEILKALPPDLPEGLHAMFNIAEDDGMEREVAQSFRGDALALGKQNEIILGEIVESWKDLEYPDNITEADVAPQAVVAIAQLSRLSWDGHSNKNREAFFNSQHPVTTALIEKLAREGWVSRLQATKNPHDCWDLACDLFKRLYPDHDEQEIEDLRKQGHSMTPCDGDEEKEGETKEGEAEGEDDGKGTKEGDEKESKKKAEAEGTVISWKDAVLSEHDNWTETELGTQAGNVGIDWNDYKKGEVCLMPANLINVIELKDKRHKYEDTNGYGRDVSPQAFMSDNSQSRSFGNQIRRYIQATQRTRVERERYHGKLDKGSIVRLALPPIDGGEYNKRIFYDFTTQRKLNTCVHVLTDWSGSMQGSKMENAADASGRLVQVFDRVLRIPVQLAAFTNSASRCDIGVIKRFNDRSMSPLNIAENFSKFYKYSSANNDADALMWAYRELLKRKEERKILIVMSDGCPAGCWKGSSHTNLLHVTECITKGGRVELYGVGIESSAVTAYYPNCKILNNSNEINSTLFEIIKEGVK